MGESKDDRTEITTTAQLQTCELGLSITRKAWTKLMAYCRATNDEVSGFMLTERDGDLFWIDDVYLVNQVSTGTSTEMVREDIMKFQMDLYKKKIIGFDGCKKKLSHFHTHPTFGVFWSPTDMEMRHKNRQGVDYFIHLVINQTGDALAAIDINGDFPMSINNLPIEIVDENHAELIAACKAEVKLKVKSPAATMWTGGGSDDWPGRYMREPAAADDQLLMGGPQYNHGNAKSCFCGAKQPTWISRDGCAVCSKTEDVKLLGPTDRRRMSKAERKARAKLERLTIELRKEQGVTSWPDYRKKLELVDKERELIKQAQSQYAPGEIDIIGESHEVGDVWSDAGGTYQNIGGEVVKIEEPARLDVETMTYD